MKKTFDDQLYCRPSDHQHIITLLTAALHKWSTSLCAWATFPRVLCAPVTPHSFSIRGCASFSSVLRCDEDLG